jgi:hypothetical protein
MDAESVAVNSEIDQQWRRRRTRRNFLYGIFSLQMEDKRGENVKKHNDIVRWLD